MHSSEKDYCYSHRVILQSNHQSNNSYYTTIELLLLRQSNTLANMKSNNSLYRTLCESLSSENVGSDKSWNALTASSVNRPEVSL